MNKLSTFIMAGLSAGIVMGCHPKQPANEKDIVLPGRHLSERQAMELASNALPQTSAVSCQFKDGVWEIFEVQPHAFGIASRTTNSEGKVTITSTNATRLVLRVRDVDGKVEPVAAP